MQIIDKKGKTRKSEAGEEVGTVVPTYRKEVGSRIKEIALDLGGVPVLAKTADVSESQLYRIISGESDTKIGMCKAIAEAGGKSLSWVITGADVAADSVAEPAERYSATHTSTRTTTALEIEKVVSFVENYLLDRNLQLPIDKKARLIALAWEFASESGEVQEAQVISLVDVVRRQRHG